MSLCPLPLSMGMIPSPSLGAGPGSREETRGRDGQEFKLVELVGEGRSAWEWPAVRAWATGPSVCRAPGEGAADGQDSAESETPQGLEGGGVRQVVRAGAGGAPRVVGQGAEPGAGAPARGHRDLRRKEASQRAGGHPFQRREWSAPQGQAR